MLRPNSTVLSAIVLLALAVPATARSELAWIPAVHNGTVTLVSFAPLRNIRSFAVEPRLGQHVESALLTPDNRTLLLIDRQLGRVVGVDLGDERSHWSVAVPEGPEAAWLTPDGRQLAVCAERAGRVVYVDLVERRIIGSIRIDGPPPEDCAFSPDGRWLALSHAGRSEVSIIDLRSGKLGARVTTGGAPGAMTFTDDELWLAIPDRNHLEVVEVGRWTRSGEVAVGLRPVALVAGSKGRRLFVANEASGTVSVIDQRGRRVLKTLAVGRSPAHLVLGTKQAHLLVTDRRHATLLSVDLAQLKAGRSLSLPHAPWGAVPQH